MLVALVDDVRVALIKLAERTCVIRAAKNDPPARRERIAREVADVYAPLAHRLGIGQLRWELEDLSFRYLEPDAYKRIASLLQRTPRSAAAVRRRSRAIARPRARRGGRDRHDLRSAEAHLQHLAEDARKGIGFARSTTCTRCACSWTTEGLLRGARRRARALAAHPARVRRLHRHAEGERLPLDPHGGDRPRGAQRRGADPHPRDARGGGARRLRALGYKGDAATVASGDPSYEEKVAWLRQVLEWQEESLGDLDGLGDALRRDFRQDRIYVLTPGRPRGSISRRYATPLDYAYRIHTEIGHRCRAARVGRRARAAEPPAAAPATRWRSSPTTTAEPSLGWLAPGAGLRVDLARARQDPGLLPRARRRRRERDGRELRRARTATAYGPRRGTAARTRTAPRRCRRGCALPRRGHALASPRANCCTRSTRLSPAARSGQMQLLPAPRRSPPTPAARASTPGRCRCGSRTAAAPRPATPSSASSPSATASACTDATARASSPRTRGRRRTHPPALGRGAGAGRVARTARRRLRSTGACCTRSPACSPRRRST